MSDLVGNPEDRFSRVEAHFKTGNKRESVFGCSVLLFLSNMIMLYQASLFLSSEDAETKIVDI